MADRKPLKIRTSGRRGEFETGDTVGLAYGGTGATDATGARSALGLGTIATQNANSVAITGGSISGITDLALADGGTGASTATAAAQNLLQAWQKISDSTYSSVGAASFTGLSAYRQIRVTGRLIPATNNVNFGYRVSTNNGSSYDATAGRYLWRYIYAAEGLTGTFETSTDNTRFYLSSSVNSSDGCWFNFHFYEFNQAVTCTTSWQFNCRRQGTSNSQFGGGGGWYNQTTARDAFQIAFSSGNIASGHILVEGLI